MNGHHGLPVVQGVRAINKYTPVPRSHQIDVQSSSVLHISSPEDFARFAPVT